MGFVVLSGSCGRMLPLVYRIVNYFFWLKDTEDLLLLSYLLK